MKSLLLSILMIQLLAHNKLYSEGSFSLEDAKKTTLVVTTYEKVSLECCNAHAKDLNYCSVEYTSDESNSKTGTCQITSTNCFSKKELDCDSCVQNGSLVIFWNITMPSTTFAQAYDYCKSHGGILALDKNKAKTELLKSIVKKLFPDLSTRDAVWIGLNRSSSSAKWMYADGTPLGSYNNWAPGRPESSVNCAEISNGKKYNFNWDNDNCNGDPGWHYYPLCEVTLPFLSR